MRVTFVDQDVVLTAEEMGVLKDCMEDLLYQIEDLEEYVEALEDAIV